ncbi:hypothetical protein Acsp06_62550 [Actinomycetospora sp. NBRC 106375]|uniref:condensation domain-containing protein n=1 Tax=Actinomycetospora sp. NBRC 106375 TaxID=3032207 RepID=UPI0024A4F7F4|nr:condensation domain-containing protein [Actinomycetospora sp. NBRC 106375]GLZ50070.1 hypothetical protein Acsp06_62550 [Actinomycetospora sp. NBRC 106375]
MPESGGVSDTSSGDLSATAMNDVCIAIVGRSYGDLADESLWGGSLDSMEIVHLIAAVAERSSTTITAAQLEDITTLRSLVELARVSDGATNGSVREPVPPSLSRSDSLRVLPNRPRYFLRRTKALDHWLLQSRLLRTRAPLNRIALERASTELVARHDGLRLRADLSSGEYLEYLVESHSAAPFVSIEVPAGSTDECYEASALEAVREVTATFSLQDQPFRVVALGSPRREYDFVVVIAHHLLVDGIAMRQIRRELEGLYYGERFDDPSTSFRDYVSARFAFWERHTEIAARYVQSLPWSDAEISLPVVSPATGPAYGSELSTHSTQVNLGRWDSCARQSSSMQTVESVLIACALAIRDRTGQDVVQIDVLFHGRSTLAPNIDVSRTVGWLSEMIPILVRADTGSLGRRFVRDQLRWASRFGTGLGHLALAGSGPAPSVLSLNAVLPEVKAVPESRLVSPTRAIPTPPAAQNAWRVYAASAGVFVEGDLLILAWDWGDALADELVHEFARRCATWFRLLE